MCAVTAAWSLNGIEQPPPPHATPPARQILAGLPSIHALLRRVLIFLWLPIGPQIRDRDPVRSFKGRGVSWVVSQLPAEMSLVCASARNFGQVDGLCLPITRYRPDRFCQRDANRLKLESNASLGSRMRCRRDFDAANVAAKDFAGQTDSRFVEGYAATWLPAKARQIWLELLRWLEAFDAVVAQRGMEPSHGAFARWVRAPSPGTSVIGVWCSVAPSMLVLAAGP